VRGSRRAPRTGPRDAAVTCRRAQRKCRFARRQFGRDLPRPGNGRTIGYRRNRIHNIAGWNRIAAAPRVNAAFPGNNAHRRHRSPHKATRQKEYHSIADLRTEFCGQAPIPVITRVYLPFGQIAQFGPSTNAATNRTRAAFRLGFLWDPRRSLEKTAEVCIATDTPSLVSSSAVELTAAGAWATTEMNRWTSILRCAADRSRAFAVLQCLWQRGQILDRKKRGPDFRHMPTGRQTAGLSVGRRGSGLLIIEPEDDGRGIPEEENLMWQIGSFFRGSAGNAHFSGSGLGPRQSRLLRSGGCMQATRFEKNKEAIEKWPFRGRGSAGFFELSPRRGRHPNSHRWSAGDRRDNYAATTKLRGRGK